LKRIDEAVPEELEIHLVMDNYGTHKMPKVQRWFARRPRYHLHFTPTSASWLNQVERFFGLLTDRRIRRGTFGSALELEAAIRYYLSHHNQNPKPFVWMADADSILKKIARFCMRTSDS
jgi:transposase